MNPCKCGWYGDPGCRPKYKADLFPHTPVYDLFPCRCAHWMMSNVECSDFDWAAEFNFGKQGCSEIRHPVEVLAVESPSFSLMVVRRFFFVPDGFFPVPGLEWIFRFLT